MEGGSRVVLSGFRALVTNGIKNVTGGRSIRAGFGEKSQEAELEVAEIKMLSLSLGATGMDWIRNEDIRGTARVRWFGDKGGPRWFLVRYNGEIVKVSAGGCYGRRQQGWRSVPRK